MQDFRSLKVWQKGHGLALAIYKASSEFPRHELFGLTSQMRRAATSIPMNIAEGCGRGSDPDFSRFLQIAMGSGSELDYQILLAQGLGYLSESDSNRLGQEISEVKRMLAALIQRLKG